MLTCINLLLYFYYIVRVIGNWRRRCASAKVNRSVSRPYKQSTYQSNTSQAVRAPPRRIPMHSGRLGSRTYRKAGYRIRRHPGNVYLSGGQTSNRQRAEARLWNPEANVRCRYSWQGLTCAQERSTRATGINLAALKLQGNSTLTIFYLSKSFFNLFSKPKIPRNATTLRATNDFTSS